MIFRKDKEEKLTNDVTKAIRKGDLDQLRKILEKNLDAVEKKLEWNKGTYNGNMLHMAAYYNQHEIVKFLVTKKGMAVDGVKRDGSATALIWAAFAGSFQTVKTLLDLGANPTYRNTKGQTAYGYCNDAATKELLRPYHEATLKQQAEVEAAAARSRAEERVKGSWKSGSSDTITYDHDLPGNEIHLKEDFDFARKCRIVVAIYLETGSPSQPETTFFSQIPDAEKGMIDQARAQLDKANGVVAAEVRKPQAPVLPLRRARLQK